MMSITSEPESEEVTKNTTTTTVPTADSSRVRASLVSAGNRPHSAITPKARLRRATEANIAVSSPKTR